MRGPFEFLRDPSRDPLCTFCSECISRAANLDHGLHQDSNIEPKAPVADVPEVGFHPPLHKACSWRLAAKTVDLSPPGYSGLHMLATRISGYQLAVLIVVRQRVGSGPDE